MNFFHDSCKRNPSLTIRVHPLLLSLTETFEASGTDPDLTAVSENDERVLGSKYYTSPGALPPLEMHFSGQNGPSPPPIQGDKLSPRQHSRLPRMHDIRPSKQLSGGGKCHSRQFSSFSKRQIRARRRGSGSRATCVHFGSCSALCWRNMLLAK